MLIDAHLDLAWNGVSFDRDLTLEVEEVRQAEAEMDDEPSRGRPTTSFPELRRAGVAIAVVTLLARSGPRNVRKVRYGRTDLDYATRAAAWSAAHAQLAWYDAMQQHGHLCLLRTAADVTSHWQSCAGGGIQRQPLGGILSMEGADPILSPQQAEYWWQAGLRALGLSHFGFSHYAAGTGVDGPLTEQGRQLLTEWQRLGGILDVTHLSDTSLDQALDLFAGPVWASHHNCRALVPGDRQLRDDQIRRLIERDAVIGAAADAWMLHPGWQRGVSQPDVVSLRAVADHVDHVCQLAGNTRHSGLGSDLDGGFGTEQTPHDLNTIVDLRKLEHILRERGYSEEDLDRIFFGNWLSRLQQWLP
jgi:membrane dipeptidase